MTRRNYLACILAIALWCGAAHGAATASTDDRNEGDEAATQPSEQMVAVVPVTSDREAIDFLRQAETAISARDYPKAEELLHSLVTGDRRALVRAGGTDDRGAWVNVRDDANRMLGLLPAEALADYARQYGAPAAKLMEEYSASGNARVLARVADEFFHTAQGAAAANLLAQRAFDEGDYLTAYSGWSRLYAIHRSNDLDRPLLLAKSAIAAHLAGLTEESARRLKELRTTAPDARARIGGEDVALTVYVDKAMGAQPATGRRDAPVAWTGPFGNSSGAGAAEDVEQAVFPLWSAPAQRPEQEARARRAAGAGDAAGGAGGQKVILDGGRVQIRIETAGGLPRTVTLRAQVHPLLVGELLIVREEACVAAYDVSTGKVGWRGPAYPMLREAPRGADANPFVGIAGDTGRYALTQGAGRVYAVGRYRPIDPATFHRAGNDAVAGSSVAAFNVADGTLAWEIGAGQGGSSDVVKAGTFLGPPACVDGRLYALVRSGSAYWAVALDAASGQTVWETQLGPVPATTGEAMSWQVAATVELLTERGGTPSVAAGRVFYATAAGIVAAVEASSGRALWARQYDSTVAGTVGARYVQPLGQRAYLLVSSRKALRPINPILTSGGRVIALPADSDQVLAMSAIDGSLLWQHPRQQLDDLTAIDDGRVLLSGPDMVIASALSGQTIKHLDGGLIGRPVVTGRAILGAEAGKIVRIGLDDYARSEARTGDDAPGLGRLMAAGGRVISANAAAVTVFQDYATASKTLQQKIAAATDVGEKARLGVARAQLLAGSGKHEEAAAALRQLLQGDLPKSSRGDAEEALLRSLLAMADGAKGEVDATHLLEEAERLPVASARAAELALRRVALLVKGGRAKDAATAAQQISERHPDDVVEGDGRRVLAREAAQGVIAQLIAKEGADVYPAGDVARQALGKATGNAEGLLAVYRRWPNSAAAGIALAEAAELLLKVRGEGADAARQRAVRIVGQMSQFFDQNSELRQRQTALAASLKKLDAESAIPLVEARGPFRELWRLDTGKPSMLRGPDEHALVLGGAIILVTDASGIRAIDTRINDRTKAQVWSAPLSGDARGRVGFVSEDGSRLNVIDGGSVAAIDSATGKVIYQKNLAGLGIVGWSQVAGNGEVAVLLTARSRMTGVWLADGRLAWRGTTTGERLSVSGDVLLTQGRGARGGVLFDLRTGRPFPLASQNERSMVTLTGQQLAAIAGPEGLSLMDPRSADHRIWTLAARKGQSINLLAADDRFLLWTDPADGLIRASDASTNGSLDLAKPEGADSAICRKAMVVGSRAYLLQGTAVAGSEELLVAPRLWAFELPSGRALWSSPLAAADVGECAAQVEVVDRIVSALVRPQSSRQPARALVISGDGTISDLSKQTASPESAFLQRLRVRTGNPHVVNGCVVIESDDGLVFLRSEL